MLTIFTFALAAQTVFAATTLLTRQTLTPSAGCVDACSSLMDAITAADTTSLAGLCTSTIVNGYAECYDCMVADGVVTQTTAQETIDDYVSGCSAAGFPVSSATVSGSSSSGGGLVSGGSAGKSTGTASGAASTSTATSSGSSSSNSGSSSSSSSGDADSSSSGSGNGLGSGSGFKSSGGERERVSAGYLAVSLIFGISAVLLRSL